MQATPGGINPVHAPALDLPARFMLLGVLGLLVDLIALPWGLGALGGGFYDRDVLAFVHLNTVGVIAAIIVGASYQLLPVTLQAPLKGTAIARPSFWMQLVGVILFLIGFLREWRVGLALGASLLVTALLAYLVIASWTLIAAPHRDIVAWHIAAALVGLLGGLTLGFLLALSKGGAFLGSLTLQFIGSHATLMVAGWVLVMLNGVAYRLIGMFTLTEDQIRPRLAWTSLLLTAPGAWLLALALLFELGRETALVGALLLIGGQSLFGSQVLLLYIHRRRRKIDVHMPFATVTILAVLTSSIMLAAGIVLDRSSGDPLWLATGWLAIGGTAITAIQGFFYKIATFLVWLHRYAPMVGRGRVPRLEELYDQRVAYAGWACWTFSLLLSTVALLVGASSLTVLAGGIGSLGLGCFLVNVALIANHGRDPQLSVFGQVARLKQAGPDTKGQVS